MFAPSFVAMRRPFSWGESSDQRSSANSSDAVPAARADAGGGGGGANNGSSAVVNNPVGATREMARLEQELESDRRFFADPPDDFVRCPGCSVVYATGSSSTSTSRPTTPHEAGQLASSSLMAALPAGYTRELPRGAMLCVEDALRHFHRSRFRCGHCDTDFCRCGVSPYHWGWSCDGWQKRQLREQTAAIGSCRWCGEPCMAKMRRSESLVGACCGNDDGTDLRHFPPALSCAEKERRGCGKRHSSCGHWCGGLRGEEKCLPCLHSMCRTKAVASSCCTGAAAGGSTSSSAAGGFAGQPSRCSVEPRVAPGAGAKSSHHSGHAAHAHASSGPFRAPLGPPGALALPASSSSPLRRRAATGGVSLGDSRSRENEVSRAARGAAAHNRLVAAEIPEVGGAPVVPIGAASVSSSSSASSLATGTAGPAPPPPMPKLPDREDWCSICWTEPLYSAPAVRLECGHVLHHHCLEAMVRKGRVGGQRLSFKNIRCPLCQAVLRHPSIDSLVATHLALYNMVRRKSLQRWVVEQRKPQPQSNDLADEDRIAAMAMAKMSFFECSQCNEPYYGGEVECRADDEEGDLDDDVQAVLAMELVCRGCASKGQLRCPEHGSEFLGWKCRYCCEREAQFFCFGTTHFCLGCHNLWQTGVEERRRLQAGKACLGKDRCIFGGRHPPSCRNGRDEYALGCTICAQDPECGLLVSKDTPSARRRAGTGCSMM